MSPTPPSFDDPALQRALRDIAGRHTASASLRARVAQKMAAVPVKAESLPIAPRGGLKRLLAMAATIVISVGVAIGAYEWYLSTPRGMKSLQANDNGGGYQAPSLWQSMVSLHDCGPNGHRVAMPTTSNFDGTPLTGSVDEMVTAASTTLKRPIPKPMFAGTKWALDAAAYCTLDGHDGVRFHLTDGARAITVISLPESAWAYRNADTYTTRVNDHPLAGYVKDGGLNCIIGDRQMPASEIEALLTQLRAQ